MVLNDVRSTIALLMFAFLFTNGIFAMMNRRWSAATFIVTAMSVFFVPTLLALGYVLIFSSIFSRATALSHNNVRKDGWQYLLFGISRKAVSRVAVPLKRPTLSHQRPLP